MSPKFQTVLLYHQSFLVTCQLETSAPKDPNLTLNTTRSNVCTCDMYSWYPRVPNLSAFCFTACNCFWVTHQFETSARTKWPKSDLEPTRSNVPHICVTSIHECKFSLRFTLRPDVFEKQAILRQTHWMTPKWPWTLQGHRYPIYVLLLPSSLKFRFFLLYDQPFSRYRPFWDKCSEWPLNDPERYNALQGQTYMYTKYVLLVSPSPRFQTVLLYGQPFSRCHTLLNGPKGNKIFAKMKNLKFYNSLRKKLPIFKTHCKYSKSVSNSCIQNALLLFKTRCYYLKHAAN